MIGQRTLAAAVVAVAAAACSGPGTPGPDATGALTARPGTPTDDASPPGPSPSAPPTPLAGPSPSDAARARFVAAHRPADADRPRDVAVDLDGDGLQEVLVGYAVDGATVVQVGRWDGDAYVVAATLRGGPADDLVDLVVRDVNGDGRTDIVTYQRVGASGHSLSLWTASTADRVDPLDAVGGCFEGANTYGDTGAELTDADRDGDADVRAVCEDDDLPQPLWPTLVYLWEDGAYRCDHEEGPEGEGPRPCREGRGPSPDG